jgi:hypothetical protein
MKPYKWGWKWREVAEEVLALILRIVVKQIQSYLSIMCSES